MKFGILGPLWSETGPAQIALAPRERVLLTVLLLQVNHTVSRERITDALWADQPPRDTTSQVHGSIHRLRKQLAAAGMPKSIIATDQAGYRVELDPADLDLTRFRELRDQARSATAAGDLTVAKTRYRAALSLWRGPALDGVRSDALRETAASLDEEHVQAREECLEVELALGKAGELVSELTEMVNQHPYRERLHEALMLALYRAGRQADALAAYQRVRRLLRDDLGAEPGAELQELHRAILGHDPDLRTPPPAASPQDRSAPPRPHELPADVAGFTGRVEALKDLDAMLANTPGGPPGAVVISAITGTAGIGKTALAIHWAHRIAEHFPDGQLHVNLRGYASKAPLRPIEALTALLRSLGTSPDQIPAEETQAAGLYRTKLAERRMLVLLDNAGSVEQVRPLVPGSPGSLVIVTSRSRLTGLVARDGARRLTLDVLTADEAYTLLATLLGSQRVEAEPEATADLARVCGYLPLAVRIAAAHLADNPTTIADYVARLSDGDRIAALQVDDDEESSVPAAFDISYRALPAPAARMFRLLGLVPGPDLTPASAAALSSVTISEATNHLALLSSAHLVKENAPNRYTFHDLLRQFAQRLCEAEEPDDVRRVAVKRLFDYYLLAADSAAGLLYPQMARLSVSRGDATLPSVAMDGPDEALAWLDAEHVNLVAAITTAGSRGLRSLAWLLADCIRGYLWYSRRTVDWSVAANAALAAAEEEGNLQAQAAARLSLAHLQHSLVKHSEAADHYATALVAAKDTAWKSGEVAALTNLGVVYTEMGRLTEAADCYSQALELCQEIGLLQGVAVNSGNLGAVFRQLGQLQRAIEYNSRALALYRELGAKAGEAQTLNHLGAVEYDLGMLDSATQKLITALSLYQQVGDRSGEASTLDWLAAVHRDLGHTSVALSYAEASLAGAQELKNHHVEAHAVNTLGSLELQLDHPAASLSHHQRALDLALDLGARLPEIYALLGLAEAHRYLGEYGEADKRARTALRLARESERRVLQGKAMTVRAEIMFGETRYHEAERTAEHAIESHRETGYRLGEARTVAVLGDIKHATGNKEAAQRYWSAASGLYAEIGVPLPDHLHTVVKGHSD